MEDLTEKQVLPQESNTETTTSDWQILWFPVHVAAVYAVVHFCTPGLAGWTRERLLPFLHIVPVSTGAFEFSFSHLFVFSFVPAFLTGLVNAKFKNKVAAFVWVVPTLILAYKLITFLLRQHRFFPVKRHRHFISILGEDS